MNRTPALRVLYVEDDTGLARLTRRRLERDGIQVDLAASGEQALEMLQTRSYDLLALDNHLPGMSGLQLLSDLGEGRLGRDLSIPPSIMITGAGDEQTAVEALKLGASDYLVKDLEGSYLDLMPAVIRQALEKQRLVQEKQLAEAALRESESRYRALFSQVVEGFALLQPVYGVDLVPLDFIFLEVNPAYESLSGTDAGQVIGSTLRQALPLSCQDLIEQLQPVLVTGEPAAFECRVSEFNRYLHITLYRPVTGQCAILLQDITERHQSEERLLYLSTHDPLTGLYNRAFFETELARLDAGRQFPVTLVMIDIDNLKSTNDRFGHAAGDDLLRRLAGLLREAFRAGDITTRIGGDEFAVLLPEMDELTARLTGERLLRLLEEHNRKRSAVSSGSPAASPAAPAQPLSISVGLATGDRTIPLTSLLRLADSRMYQEKTRKKSAVSPLSPGVEPGPAVSQPVAAQAEQALPAAAGRLASADRLLLDSSPDPAVLVDASGLILAANLSFSRQVNLPLEKLAGTGLFPLLDRQDPDLGAELQRQCQAALHSGKPARFERQHEKRRVEYTLHPLPVSQDQVARLAITTHDLTAYHLSLRQVQHSLDQVHTVLEAMDDGLLVLDAGRRLVFANPAAVRSLGLPPLAAEGGIEYSAWRPALGELRQAGHAGEPLEETLAPWSQAQSGNPTPPDVLASGRWLLRARPVPDASGQPGALLLIKDILQTRQTEAALQQLEKRLDRLQEHNQRMADEIHLMQDMRTSLLREVNHRVRTNLSLLIGMLSLQQDQARLAEAAAGAPGVPSVTRLYETLSMRIQSLAVVHSLLSASEWTPLPLNELAANVIETALHDLPERSRIQVTLHPSDARLTLDQAHNLALVLSELTTNAVRYALGERPAAHIDVYLDSSPDLVHIEFCDDGPGFPPDLLERFARSGSLGPAAGSQPAAGSLAEPGTGLELVRILVQRSLGGALELRNTPGATLLIRFKARV